MKSLPKGMFFAYLVKMLIITPSFSDMGILIALASVVGVEIFLEKQKSIDEVKDACAKQVQDIQIVVNKQNDVIAQFAVEFSKMKNDVSGLRIKQDFQKIDGFGKKVG